MTYSGQLMLVLCLLVARLLFWPRERMWPMLVLPALVVALIVTLSRSLGITVVIVTHELPSIFLVADNCIVLDKEAKGIVARGDPRRLRDESAIPFVHNFFTRSSPGASATGTR